MESNVLNYTSQLKHVKNSGDENKKSKPSNASITILENEKAMKDHLLLRMQEMEEINSYLENLVEHQKKKLAELTATNSKFVSIIAHDLRGPFSAILGVFEILHENLKNYDTEEIDKFINIGSESVNRTLTLLNNLLAWTISQNKGKSFNPIKVNLPELVAYEIDSIQALAAKKQIMVSHSIAPYLNVTADLQMVRTILRNLINNAVKYTNKGGTVMISATERKQLVEIKVTDNGIGMSAKTRHNLFKMDHFQSIAGTDNEKGTGLGLMLCKEFVEMHGGSIWVASALGDGSEFTFTLPHYI